MKIFYPQRKYCILDPFISKRNIARTLSGIQIYEYICDRLHAAYSYFGIARTSDGPLFTEIDPNFIASQLRENLKKLVEDMVSGGTPAQKTADAQTEGKQLTVPALARSDPQIRTADDSASDTSTVSELKTDSVTDLSSPVEITNLGSGECKFDDDSDMGDSYLPSSTGAGDTPECTIAKPAHAMNTQAGSLATNVIRDVVLDFRVNAVISHLNTDSLGNVVSLKEATPSVFPVEHLATDFLGNLNVVSVTDSDDASTNIVIVDIGDSSKRSDGADTCDSGPAVVAPPFDVPLGKNGKRVHLKEIEKVTEEEFAFLFTPETLFDGKVRN